MAMAFWVRPRFSLKSSRTALPSRCPQDNGISRFPDGGMGEWNMCRGAWFVYHGDASAWLIFWAATGVLLRVSMPMSLVSTLQALFGSTTSLSASPPLFGLPCDGAPTSCSTFMAYLEHVLDLSQRRVQQPDRHLLRSVGIFHSISPSRLVSLYPPESTSGKTQIINPR